MLDYELVKIYGYETKRFNEQVKNNINKFPERYRFQLIRKKRGRKNRPRKFGQQIKVDVLVYHMPLLNKVF